jgi:murein DD-endopeptidase MepM/ murein hydrolase activator NlpD
MPEQQHPIPLPRGDGELVTPARLCATWLTVLAVALVGSASAAAAAAGPGALGRLEARRETLAEQTRNAERLARQEGRAAYRLARRRQADFLTVPETRLGQSRDFDLALLAARRSAGEAQALRNELARVNDERIALAHAAAGRAGMSPRADSGEGLRLTSPVRGTVVGVPGLRPDPVTGAEVRQYALQILARMNEPVCAPAPGTVRRVEPLPQGGFAVAIEHPGGWVSLLTGLREVKASPGDDVTPLVSLGLAGRNLDGAVVVSLELWHARAPVDPRPLLRRRRQSAVQ